MPGRSGPDVETPGVPGRNGPGAVGEHLPPAENVGLPTGPTGVASGAMSSPSHDRRAVRLGLAGVLLAFVVLASLHALTVSPFLPADERSHTGYGLLVLVTVPLVLVAMVARSLRMLDGGVARITVPAPAAAVPELARGGP
jgi:hypothetical protein